MTRKEQLVFCKVCNNRKFDRQLGIICGLTNQTAEFEGKCDSYLEDSKLKQKIEADKIENEFIARTASKGKRFANYIIDLVFYSIFSLLFGIFLGFILLFISPSSISYLEQDYHLVINYLLGFISGMVYYSFLEATTGRTIAKFITKTIVVNEKGEQPSFGTILLRSLCRFIPFEQFSFFDSGNSGLHDRISKTRVIDLK